MRIIALLAVSLAGFAVSAAPAQNITRSAATREATSQYKFSSDDDKFLDEVQHAAFLYFWKEVGEPAKLAKDRKRADASSIAAVGFQLAALPIAVERGWVKRAEAEQVARTVLTTLLGRTDNRYKGMYKHFPDFNTGGKPPSGYNSECSTVDSSLLFAGAMAAASYFGGDVDKLTERMLREADWKFFTATNDGMMSMGWESKSYDPSDGKGELIKAKWHIASCEEHIIYFLAVGSPEPERAVSPELYYRLQRTVKRHGDGEPFVVSAQGTLFHYFFSHLFIDYRRFDADNPRDFGVDGPRVDWFENSRRATLAHIARCKELSSKYKTLTGNIWGLSAAAARDGYIVPEIMPNLIDKEQLHEGTVAPYAAAASIVFTPAESVAALRAMRELKGEDGKPFVWRDPSAGGYGFLDSFNLDQKHAEEDYTGIDQGPMLLAIENARTGLVWRLFMQHPIAKAAVERLKLKEVP